MNACQHFCVAFRSGVSLHLHLCLGEGRVGQKWLLAKRGRKRVYMLHQIAREVIKEERCKLIVQKAAGSNGSLVMTLS